MNPLQEDTFQQVNDAWGIDEYELVEDGTVTFTADDGDEGTIDEDGVAVWTTGILAGETIL